MVHSANSCTRVERRDTMPDGHRTVTMLFTDNKVKVFFLMVWRVLSKNAVSLTPGEKRGIKKHLGDTIAPKCFLMIVTAALGCRVFHFLKKRLYSPVKPWPWRASSRAIS